MKMNKPTGKLLEAEKLCFAYQDNHWILKDINFSLLAGEIVGIMGPSGSGKSTLCHCLCGVIPHIYPGRRQGRVLIGGADVNTMKLADIAQKIGVLFQDPDTQLFSSTLEEDVVFGPENLCWSWREMDNSLNDSLAATFMSEYRYRNPKTLSGGQGQLAALSAVLALNPPALIFDEAMSRLDEKGVGAVQDCAVNLKKQGCGVIMVEHDPEHLKIADRLFWLAEGFLQQIAVKKGAR